MQFKYPELLYALFLLLIPIIIHLFQLRRFQKIEFTNVAFLKKVAIQTRKSSQLKKWLTLLMRLGAFACLIIAFAQPFSASETALNTKKETVLYIDNSFSMQARDSQGPLLQRTLQNLFEQSNGKERLSWFTNTETHKNVSSEAFKNDLLSIPYSQEQLGPSEILLKAKQLFSKDAEAGKRIIIISDFQLKDRFPTIQNQEITIDAIQVKPTVLTNIAIDTAYIASKNASSTQLEVVVSNNGEETSSVPISLYNGKTLVAKTAADFNGGNQHTLNFDIENTTEFQGRLSLNEQNITFDNQLYFSINKPQKIKVLSINEANANFISRLFDQPEFNYVQQSLKSLNYNDIPSQNFIILNELNSIPEPLVSALKFFSSNGGSTLIIPSKYGSLDDYNSLLSSFQLGSLTENRVQDKRITQIIFDHPLFEGVFEKRVVNFQYPKVNSYFAHNSNSIPVLKYDDGRAFMLQQDNNYLFTSPINQDNSNFQNSPLIVPSFYNMAQQSLELPKLYYTIGRSNTFAVPVVLKQDEIVKLRDSVTSLIPLQQSKANKVNISTYDEPSKAGIFEIIKDEAYIEHVSYNYDRRESVLQYADPSHWSGVNVYENVEELFSSIAKENTIHRFWKWFAIFALLFLLMEMLILKFYR